MAPRLPDRQPELTARHREVARLVAEGRTNGQIGDELDISLDGAKYHVTQLLMRLGLERREEIAEWYRGEQRWSVRRLAPAGLAGVGTLAGRVVVAGALVVAVAIAALIVATRVRDVDETILVGTVVVLPEIRLPSLHTATLLADGRVLLTGADGPDGFLRTALVFDPATRAFMRTGAMTEGRSGHSATLLPDGRVLITGGARFEPDASAGWLETAEVFDPETGRFSSTGPMTVPRWWHRAALLPDGRVLVVGGGRGSYSSSTAADVYDPSTGTFEAVGSARGLPFSLAMVTTVDGSIILFGREMVERYDTLSAEFVAIAETSDPTTGAAAAALIDGTVLVTGGIDYTALPASMTVPDDGSPPPMPAMSASRDAFLVDAETGETFLTGPLVEARTGHVAIALSDGRALILGGMVGTPALPYDPEDDDASAAFAELIVTSAEIYDPDTGQFTLAADPGGRGLVTSATLLGDGTVLIVESSFDGETSARVYRP